MDTSVTMDWFKDKDSRVDGLLYYACMGTFFAMPLGTAPMNICGILAVTIWLFSGKAIRHLQILIHHSWFWPVLVLIILPWMGLLFSPDETGQPTTGFTASLSRPLRSTTLRPKSLSRRLLPG